ncbi:hypothetical protein Dda_0788 [Drechslerella dactyloides]|uniref:ubiquitinyl hydrolase 1 n=1 Tax=Drechslerella dactyloides TaxID=74499 RepID=A0AAD6NMY7_DREDA|nr:hypothetical protein Dda_0788 [Drechslerella dactyloides]
MSSFFKRSKSSASGVSPAAAKKKEETVAAPTPIQQLVQDAPQRTDGSDKFWGYENVFTPPQFGNTCYCNSMLQCLYYSKQFREAVISYPRRSLRPGSPNGALNTNPKISRISTEPAAQNGRMKAGVGAAAATATANPIPLARRGSTPASAAVSPNPQKPEDKDSPEAKKKAALAAGPMLAVELPNSKHYDMQESLFTAMKDLFESIVYSESRTGVVSPLRFVEVLKMKNELFRSQMHQDAHEFFNYCLNEVIENVEDHAKTSTHSSASSSSSSSSNDSKEGSSLQLVPGETASAAESTTAVSTSVSTMSESTATIPNAGWVHDLFEGALTSETKCLTCENVSRRDEPFLDLSIDLEKHSSVTSCLRNFSASEMLCERNKFHCDVCGGLQEAEKRMKIKRLPKVLALHLKRFKYMEELGRHQKLFHRVVYPYHLRLFNTTDDAEDPDRLYELYGVIIHIGGGPYHGHYVAIIKTEEHGWLLYDDEMVEPVDKSFVRNFFGDRPGLACAYVLFYQETTLEAVERENLMEEERAAAKKAKLNKPDAKADVKKKPSKEKVNGHANGHAIPVPVPLEDVPDVAIPEGPKTPTLGPQVKTPTGPPPVPAIPSSYLIPKSPVPEATSPVSPVKSKKEREREHREEKAREKEREKQAKKEEKERGKEAKHKNKEEKENGGHGLSRFRPPSIGKKPFGFNKMVDREREREPVPPLPVPIPTGSPNPGDSSAVATPTPSTTNLVQSPLTASATVREEARDTFSERYATNGSAGHKEEKKHKEKEEKHHRASKMLRKKLSILG